MILYPVFIHMYLELVYNGHEQHGKCYTCVCTVEPQWLEHPWDHEI